MQCQHWPLCAAPGRPAMNKNSPDAVHIRVMRSRLPRALELRLCKKFAYQAAYFPSHQFDQVRKKKNAKKNKNTSPCGFCGGGRQGKEMGSGSERQAGVYAGGGRVGGPHLNPQVPPGSQPPPEHPCCGPHAVLWTRAGLVGRSDMWPPDRRPS